MRRHAFDTLVKDHVGAYAAREILTFDEDAEVRARAALFLGDAPTSIALGPLHEALEDAMPIVRHAAARALVGHDDPSSLPPLARVALEDPIWWVRRAAVVTSAVLGKSASIAMLREALEDPFWRVRAAAVRALLALGEEDVLERLGPATSPRSSGALSYIARRLGANARAASEIEVPNAIVARLDPDPAVVTARIERGDAVTTAFLVECLGDPHEALRVTARKRLARSRDRRAFELALLWLDEPRIPHAAQTVIALLDGLEAEDASHMLDVAFERGGFGALCWAASYVGLTRDESRREALLAHASHEHPMVRCAVIEALAALGDEDAVTRALDDRDPRVVRVAAQALGRDAPKRAGDLGDEDPWVRTAALDATSAPHALAHDTHPWVRRAAFTVLARVDERLAAELASRCDDPWLQTRAAAMLDPRDPAHLVELLRMSRSSSRAVCAAAGDALLRKDLDAELDAVLRTEKDATVRIAALTHRSRRFEPEDFDRLRAARAAEPEAVRAWIDDLLDENPPAPPKRARVAIDSAPLRPLGKTGLEVPAMVVSGAGMLSPRAYADAMRAGCNLFFWEPRYHGLGRMLARHRDARVVCGTYHATERAIVSDVERSLRKLRRDALDVFLLFWARSPARVDAEAFAVLSRLKKQGKIRAFGFSTHDREIACDAIAAHEWDVVMTRHSLVHPGAEKRFLPLAREKNVGVLGFSALSYGRALRSGISAAEAYRYSLSQPGVSAVLSAPRSTRELEENLAVLRAPPLAPERCRELRAIGATVHEESADFARSIRRHPINLSDAVRWLDHEDALDPSFA